MLAKWCLTVRLLLMFTWHGSGAFTPQGAFFQYAFMDDSNAWLRALRQVRIRPQSWLASSDALCMSIS